MNLPRGWELVLVVLVIVLLFGAKRLPDAARSVGRSLRIFKAETKGLNEGTPKAGELLAGDPPATSAPEAAPESPQAHPQERSEG
jgi:sec-independent protein translocase protein TatA